MEHYFLEKLICKMNKNVAGIKGFDKVLKNINRELKAIKGRSLQGLIKAQIVIRRDMEVTPPLVPVDVGNLRASWFCVTSSGKAVTKNMSEFKHDIDGRLSSGHAESIESAKSKLSGKRDPALIMGFSAFYAWFVHENIGAHFQRPGAGAQFFLSALNRNKKRIRDVIKKSAKIRK